MRLEEGIAGLAFVAGWLVVAAYGQDSRGLENRKFAGLINQSSGLESPARYQFSTYQTAAVTGRSKPSESLDSESGQGQVPATARRSGVKGSGDSLLTPGPRVPDSCTAAARPSLLVSGERAAAFYAGVSVDGAHGKRAASDATDRPMLARASTGEGRLKMSDPGQNGNAGFIFSTAAARRSAISGRAAAFSEEGQR